MTNPKVLVVATSRMTRGGITSVVKAHEMGAQWEKYHCKWIGTHIDKGVCLKLLYLVKGFIQYLLYVPFYDIVHIHMSEPASAVRKCLFMFVAKLWHKKVIVHFHAFSPDTTINSKYKRIYRYLFSKADNVIVLSEFWRKAVKDAFGLEDKVKVIYNPCTTEISKKKYEKKKQILYAGTVNARKGYADMIKAFSRVALKYPDWKIVFAGNGEIEQGMSLAKELGIEGQTIFLGWVNGDDKDKAFKESTIFCLPSYAEGFPMGVLDAWAYGLPVITTPVGGIPDIAIDGKNLLLFNPGDINELSEQMSRMISNEKLRDSIAKESIRLSETTFNLKSVNEQVGILYNQMLGLHYKVDHGMSL